MLADRSTRRLLPVSFLEVSHCSQLPEIFESSPVLARVFLPVAWFRVCVRMVVQNNRIHAVLRLQCRLDLVWKMMAASAEPHRKIRRICQLQPHPAQILSKRNRVHRRADFDSKLLDRNSDAWRDADCPRRHRDCSITSLPRCRYTSGRKLDTLFRQHGRDPNSRVIWSVNRDIE